MQKINLRELYPDMYKTDTFLEVTDEVQAVFLSDKRAEAAHERQMYRYKAQYSLDCNNGIEDAVVHRSPTPEEVLEEKQLRDQLYAAVMELPDKQAKLSSSISILAFFWSMNCCSHCAASLFVANPLLHFCLRSPVQS